MASSTWNCSCKIQLPINETQLPGRPTVNKFVFGGLTGFANGSIGREIEFRATARLEREKTLPISFSFESKAGGRGIISICFTTSGLHFDSS